MQKIVIASKNKGKLKEINELLNDTSYIAISMEDAGFDEDIEENGKTLEENAYIKAKAIFDKVNICVMADDSGLFIDALGGEPGIFSARYAGEPKSNEANITKVLSKLSNEGNRTAHFGAVICFINAQGIVQYFEGKVHGKILHEKSGDKGFGYDPIFQPDGYDHSFAVLSDDIKNAISHRAIAIQKFLKAVK